MIFLDESGLKKLWTKIKANFGTVVIASDYEESYNKCVIPFVTNHQIVNVDDDYTINVYDWFQKASKGGILEIIGTFTEGCSIYCSDNNNKSYLRKMTLTSNSPTLTTITSVSMQYNNYVRLIKMSNYNLIVAEFVQNK